MPLSYKLTEIFVLSFIQYIKVSVNNPLLFVSGSDESVSL